jgi:hypothetical protein
VFIDGVAKGSAPLTTRIAAGRHRVHIVHGGRRSENRTVLLQYGDPARIHIDLDTAPGRLIVQSTVSNAEVTLDGVVIGYTPLDVAVAPGTYRIQVAKIGYQPDTRQVTVSARGTQQIRATLVAAPGTNPEGDGETPGPTGKWLFGTAYGLDLQAEGARYLLELGYRLANDRLDVSGMLGVVGIAGSSAGVAAGVEAKLYFKRGKVRPYARGAVITAKTSSNNGFRFLLTEASFGISLEGRRRTRRPSTAPKFFFEYFVEVGVSVRVSGGPEVAAGEDEPTRFGIPIVGGLMFRFGG